ncbi:MAG: porin family protein [Bacteroidales bacterium]|nr:porin family protein [Bacteroidales bacterium]
MKKLFATILAASLLLVGMDASAQTWTAAGGYTTFNLAGEDSQLVMDEALPGFYFGVSYDYAFSTIDGLTVEPGLYISHYGKEFGYKTFEKSYHANYLSVPLNIKYEIPMEGSFALTAFTGPRFNLGIGGNMFSKGESYMGLKIGDAQWGFGLSAMLEDAIMIRGGYDFGLTKCIKDNTKVGFDNLKVFRNTIYFGVGFVF